MYRHVKFTCYLSFSGKSTLRQRVPCRKLHGGEPLGSTPGRVREVGWRWGRGWVVVQSQQGLELSYLRHNCQEMHDLGRVGSLSSSSQSETQLRSFSRSTHPAGVGISMKRWIRAHHSIHCTCTIFIIILILFLEKGLNVRWGGLKALKECHLNTEWFLKTYPTVLLI